eukprot:4641092-Amphidinium_carterae.1
MHERHQLTWTPLSDNENLCPPTVSERRKRPNHMTPSLPELYVVKMWPLQSRPQLAVQLYQAHMLAGSTEILAVSFTKHFHWVGLHGCGITVWLAVQESMSQRNIQQLGHTHSPNATSTSYSNASWCLSDRRRGALHATGNNTMQRMNAYRSRHHKSFGYSLSKTGLSFILVCMVLVVGCSFAVQDSDTLSPLLNHAAYQSHGQSNKDYYIIQYEQPNEYHSLQIPVEQKSMISAGFQELRGTFLTEMCQGSPGCLSLQSQRETLEVCLGA